VERLLIPTTQQVNLCAGEGYQVGDSLYTHSGRFQHVFQNSTGCDSLLLTDLIILPAVGSSQQITLCAGQQLVVGDNVYTQPGTYQTRLVRAFPLCDSLVTTQLVVRQIELNPPVDTVINQGDSIQLGVIVPSGAIYSYTWSPPLGLSCPTCPTTWASHGQTTRYKLSARIPNTDCQTNYNLTVAVLGCQLAVSTAYTPMTTESMIPLFFG
jgi:hypothetical protein